jgi:hypothetical protein
VIAMLTMLIVFMAGAFGGAVVGGLLVRLVTRSARRWCLPSRRMPDHMAVDPVVEGQITEAASQWASAHGRPEAVADLIADKLRLTHALSQQRAQRPPRRRWSR